MLLKQKKLTAALLCGLLGCLCFGAGDWLMIYGDTAHSGVLSWLTVGTAQIPPWRNGLAMAPAFPGIIFYGIALFSIAAFLCICKLFAALGSTIYPYVIAAKSMADMAVTDGRQENIDAASRMLLSGGRPDHERSAVHSLGVARPDQRGFHAAAVSLLGLVVAER